MYMFVQASFAVEYPFVMKYQIKVVNWLSIHELNIGILRKVFTKEIVRNHEFMT